LSWKIEPILSEKERFEYVQKNRVDAPQPRKIQKCINPITNLNYNDSTEPGDDRSNYFPKNAFIFGWRREYGGLFAGFAWRF